MPACGKTGRKPDARAQGCRRKASENQTSPDISLVREADLRTPRHWVGSSEEATSKPCNHGSDTLYFIFGSVAPNLVCALPEVLRCSGGLLQECCVLFSFYRIVVVFFSLIFFLKNQLCLCSPANFIFQILLLQGREYLDLR